VLLDIIRPEEFSQNETQPMAGCATRCWQGFVFFVELNFLSILGNIRVF